MKNTLHIYTRVSTTSQEEDGTSLETQLEHGIERANKLNMKHKLWNEGGQSSSKDDLNNRPILAELLQKIDDGIIKHLYVWNTDRLSRNLNTWGMIRFKLIKNEIILHTPTGKQILSDPQTNMMLGILSEISQYDNQIRTERCRLGKIKKLREGGWMGGPPPFGYLIVDGHLAVEKNEKKWVNYIFEKYRDGKSIDEIRTLLLKNSVLTRRGNVVWSHGSISKLLTNSHYGGFYKYTDKKNNETIRISCPSIVKSSLILQVNKLREIRSYGKNGKRTKTSNEKYIYLLRDFLICGHCGSRYTGNYKKTQTSYYSCSQKTNKFKTTHTDRHIVCTSKRNIRIDRTDEVVWNTILDVVEKSHLFKETIKTELLNGISTNQSKTEIKKLKTRLRKVEQEIIDVTDSIVGLETTKILGKRNEKEIQAVISKVEAHRLELENEKEEINSSVVEKDQKQKFIDWVREFGKKINELKKSNVSISNKKKFIEGLLDKVVVTNIDTQTFELKIYFRLGYVGDKLFWNDENNKSLGYTIKNGKKIKKERFNLLKKSTT